MIDLKRDAIPEIVLNKLYKHTQMQSTFGVIMLALVDGVPRVMDLKTILGHFIEHRHTVVLRRTEYSLRVAREREHILEGLKIAVDNIDEVVRIIRGSKDTDEASASLQERFGLTDKQAEAILAMRLSRLTGLEIEKLEEELTELRATIEGLDALMASRDARMTVVREELAELSARYGDERRSQIIDAEISFNPEDLIADEPMVITISHQGYIKRIAPATYRQQRRGGRGIAGMDTKEEDWVEHLFMASTHDYLCVFTARGQVYWLKVHQIPLASRTSRGKPVVNLLDISKDEAIASILRVREFDPDRYVLFATRSGQVKKTSLAAYRHVRTRGINAINVDEGDRLIDARLTDGHNDLILATRKGMAIRFKEGDVREMGRAARGVRGVRLRPGDEVVGAVVMQEGASLLTVTSRGGGKRTRVEDYRVQRRGGTGLINFRLSEKTGDVVGVREVTDEDELMLVTRGGVINRQAASQIRVIGRATQGVRIIALDEGDELMDIAKVAADLDEGADDDLADESPEGDLGDAADGDEEIEETAEAGE